MSSQKNNKIDTSFDLNDEQIVSYLKHNPDFFLQNPDVLLKLNFPHSTGSAVSILQYQIDRYRNKERETHKKLNELIKIARENDKLSDKINTMTLSLIKLDNLDAVIEQLHSIFKKDFHANFVSITLFEDNQIKATESHPVIICKDDHVSEIFENFFKANRPLCGRLKQQQLDFLFSEDAANIGSAVLMPLGSLNELGMIAIGSENEKRFQSSMGTIYLNQMSKIITQILKRFIN